MRWSRTSFICAAVAGSPIVSAGLIGYYPLTCNLQDVSGHGNDGTVGPSAPSFAGGAAVFSGSDGSQYFTLPINLNALDKVTFGAMIKVTSTDPIRGIISNDPGGYGRTIDIDYRAGLNGFSAFSGPTGVFGGAAPTTDAFDFVAVSYDHTAGAETLYVDGQKFTATGVPPDGDPFITVGRNPHFDMPFGGSIANLFVFDSVLSDAQIAKLGSQAGQALLPGDTNGDGTVNFSDLLALAQHYGSHPAKWSQGDFNCDGTVNFSDLLSLAQHYGKTSAIAGMTGGAAPAFSSVPEPAAVGMLAIAGLMVPRRRRR